MPIIIGNESVTPTAKQVFLVHLEVNKMIVTVYTTEEFAKENEP